MLRKVDDWPVKMQSGAHLLVLVVGVGALGDEQACYLLVAVL
jgi:hypothetical protein